VPQRYRFLPSSRTVLTTSRTLPKRFDIAIVLECATLKRAGTGGPLARRAHTIINIDHHLNNHAYGTYNLVDPAAPATVVLAEALRLSLGVPLTKAIATNLYVGLYTETGGFRYHNTTPDVLRLASQLVEAGVNPRDVGVQIYEREPLRRFKLLARALESLTVRENLSWMAVTRDDFASTGTTEVDTEDFVEYPRAVNNVTIAAFLRETANGDVRVSLRAKSDIPVNRIAEHFCGGAHAYAAGCTLNGVTIEEARRRLAAACAKQMKGHRKRSR